MNLGKETTIMVTNIKELGLINFDKIEEDEFWNQSEQKELSIHKVHVYPAKFPSLIAQKAIEYCKKNKHNVEIVSDIFCGCGTVAVEAKRLGYDFYGCDINPVAVMIASVKSESYEKSKIEKSYKNIVEKYTTIEIQNKYEIANERLKYWYVESQYNELYALKETIIFCVQEEKYKKLFLCIFSSILKATSKWLTKSIKPQVDPNKEIHNVLEMFEKQYKIFLKAIEQIYYEKNAKVEIECKNVLDVDKKEYVDLIITSPPYVTSYEYADLHQLSTLWLDYTADYKELREDSIGSLYNSSKKEYTGLSEFEKKIVEKMEDGAKRKAVERYYSDMGKVVNKANELLKNSGIIVVVIGDTEYKGIKMQNAYALAEKMLLNGFEILEITKRKISNKFLPTHRDSTGKFSSNKEDRQIYSQEYILIGRKKQ